MKKTSKNLALLYMIFAVALVTANAVSAKLWSTGIHIGGVEVMLTVGTIAYPITFLITDTINEIWGKDKAVTAVKFGLVAQIMATIFVVIARFMPTADPEMQQAYVMVLGQNWMFVIASLSAYFVSQTYDVHIFSRIREKMMAKYKNEKLRGVWNNISTGTSQLLDTIIFVLIAFGIGFGWLWSGGMIGVMLLMILGQYLLKLLIAFADTPFFYLLTRKR